MEPREDSFHQNKEHLFWPLDTIWYILARHIYSMTSQHHVTTTQDSLFVCAKQGFGHFGFHVRPGDTGEPHPLKSVDKKTGQTFEL